MSACLTEKLHQTVVDGQFHRMNEVNALDVVKAQCSAILTVMCHKLHTQARW